MRPATDNATPDLFEQREPKPEPARARKTDPETSHAAAALLTPNLPRLDATLLEGLRRCGERGATSYELSEILHIDRVTVSPRLLPMSRKGLVEATNERRPGPTGRPGIVWRIVRPPA